MSDEDHEAFRTSNKYVNDIIVQAKQEYLVDKLSKADTKTVFQVVNSLLHKNDRVLPLYEDPVKLGNRFGTFFVNKIHKIREGLKTTIPQIEGTTDTPVCTSTCNSNVMSDISEFKIMSEENIKCILLNMSNASCSLDAQPTWLLKKNLNCNVPIA